MSMIINCFLKIGFVILVSTKLNQISGKNDLEVFLKPERT